MIFCFCTDKQSQKSELQWMNLPMVNLLVVEPPNPVLLTLPISRCARFGFPKKLRMMSKLDHEWLHLQRNVTPRLSFHSLLPQPCSCYCGLSELPALLDFKGEEAGEEKLERSLKRAGNCSVGSWAVGSWSEVPWYLKWSNFCAPFLLFPSSAEPRSCHGTLHGVTKILET